MNKKRKIEDRRKKPQGKNLMSASATQGGHNYSDSGLSNVVTWRCLLLMLLLMQISSSWSQDTANAVEDKLRWRLLRESRQQCCQIIVFSVAFLCRSGGISSKYWAPVDTARQATLNLKSSGLAFDVPHSYNRVYSCLLAIDIVNVGLLNM